MKKNYIYPSFDIQPLSMACIICTSGGPKTSSNIDVHSEGQSGNVASAF